MSQTDCTALASNPVDVAAIERELAQRWCQLRTAAGEPLTTRACMANLLVFCRNAREEARVTEDLPFITARHPSRVLLLMADPNSQDSDLGAFVRTHCCTLEEGQQLWSEHVHLRAGGVSMRRLPSTVRSLLLGDLPTALWWASPEAPPLIGELFNALVESTDQVIYDSMAWTDPVRQLILMANWIGGQRPRVISDLAWRRPKLWRRIIAQSLDPESAPGALEAISEIHIEHGPHALTQAWLLVGWLALRLGWQPRGGRVFPGPEVHWRFAWSHGTPQVRIRRLPEGVSEIKTLRIITRAANRPTTFHFRAESASRVSVFAEGLSDRLLTLTSPMASRAELIARQLPDLTRDRLFEDSVALARTMAEAVL